MKPPYFCLAASIVPGLGAASRNLSLQLPLLAAHFPEIASCHPGTINVRFGQPLTIARPDHRSAPLAWVPERTATEVFDLVRVELELPPDRPPTAAWLYVAHRSPHRADPFVHELIAARQDLQGTTECRIRVSSVAVHMGPAGTMPAFTSPAGREHAPARHPLP